MSVKLNVPIVKSEARNLLRNPYNFSMMIASDAYLLHNTPENPTIKEFTGKLKGYSVLPYGFAVRNQYVTRIQKIVQRYKKFSHYMTETRHEWYKVGGTSWGDNSVDELQKSKKTGETRTVQVIPPHGDVCF